MTLEHEEIRNRLRRLQADYGRELPARVDELLSLWRRAGEAPTEADRDTLIRRLHALAGSAGSFGFGELGQQARALEQLFNTHGPGELAAQREMIAGQLAALAALCAGRPPEGPAGMAAVAEPRHRRPPLIALYEPEGGVIGLQSRLIHFGYLVERHAQPDTLCAAVAARPPQLLVLNLEDASPAGVGDWLAPLQASLDSPLPVLFISNDTRFEARLAAVRQGGFAFFSRPFEMTDLMDRIDEVLAQGEAAPIRVLVVDDDLALAKRYALVLGEAGMAVEVANRARDAVPLLERFRPDLVLMDLYLPGCSGIELAQLIRQDNCWLGVPIVFLSSETRSDRQLEALVKGGDEFLTKPIGDRQLVAMVMSRARRARLLDGVMSSDSLTGLLKHSKIKEALQLELERQQRRGGWLAFAMIDIDHFKRINDSYGHQVGDQVIKSLSRLLRQRLRSTDLIGRYGGEEFAVVLSDTDPEGGFRAVEELRRAFAAIEHEAGRETFRVTLSAGIAACRDCDHAGRVTELADQALYRAKRGGRNRVEMDRLEGAAAED